MKSKIYILITALLVLIVGFILTFAYNMNIQVEKSGGFIIPKTAFSNGTYDLTARVKETNESVIDEFSVYVSKTDLDKIKGDDFSIIVYRLNAQAYEVYFNDTFLGSVGDMEEGRSHTYNSSNSFSAEKSLINDSNKLTIRTYGIYMTGLELNSVGITDSDTARKIDQMLHIRTSGFSMIGIGVIIFGILISILTYLRSDRKNKALVFLSVAVIFLSIYSFEYLSLPYLSIHYMLFKKLIIISLYACIFFFGLAFREYYKKWYLIAISTSMLIIVSISALFTQTLIAFKFIYGITSFGIVISLIFWFLYSLFNKDDSEERYVFASSTLMLVLIALADTIVLFVVGGMVSTSIINHVMVFIYILVMLMSIELHRRNVKISREASQRSHFYQQSITDDLTGAFNKNHMIKVLNDEIPPLSIAMIDIDHFKEINDTHGHQCGDFILEYIVSKMREEFRDTDLIGRYGGDEFMAILIGCSERNAFDIMNRFRKNLELDKIHYEEKEINVTVSVGIKYTKDKPDIMNIIKSADQALYRAKDSGRNRVSI